MIPKDLIIIWPLTNAGIPTNYVRETDLDNLYPKGAAHLAEPNTTGGNETHSHSATASHGHTMASHSHTVALSNVSSVSSNSTDSNGTEAIPGSHSHNISLAGLSGGGLSSVPATYASVSNHPPFKRVIFIKATKLTKIPEDGVMLTANPLALTKYTGFLNCDGEDETVDLRDKFLRGAATDGDSGDTGGSYTNIHDLTHTHVESAHGHSGSTGGQITDSGGKRAQSGNNRLSRGHTHGVSLNSKTVGGISSVQLTTTETVQPAFRKLLAIQNKAGRSLFPKKGMVGMWLRSLQDIPPGWFICNGQNGTPDMRTKFLKIANDESEVGQSGGSHTHTHASQAHGHTGASHNHTGPNTDDHWSKNTNGPVGGNQDLQDGGAAHSITSVSSVGVTWNNSNTAADEQNNEPPYRTVVYLMFKYAPGGALLPATQ